MRLIDRLLEAPMELLWTDSNGEAHSIPGPGASADIAAQTDAVYVLDHAASFRCVHAALHETGLFTMDRSRLRLPQRCCWIEWFQVNDGDERRSPEARAAALAVGSADGLSGEIAFFREGPRSTLEECPVRVTFDLTRRSRLNSTKLAGAAPSLELPSFAEASLDEWWDATLELPRDRARINSQYRVDATASFAIVMAFCALQTGGALLASTVKASLPARMPSHIGLTAPLDATTEVGSVPRPNIRQSPDMQSDCCLDDAPTVRGEIHFAEADRADGDS